MGNRVRMNAYVDADEWEYFGRLADLMGQSRSSLLREMIETFVGQMRRAFGEELDAEKIDANQFFRVMIMDASQAISQSADFVLNELPNQTKKSKKEAGA